MVNLKIKKVVDVGMPWIKEVAMMYYIELGLLELIEDFECLHARAYVEENGDNAIVRFCCYDTTSGIAELR